MSNKAMLRWLQLLLLGTVFVVVVFGRRQSGRSELPLAAIEAGASQAESEITLRREPLQSAPLFPRTLVQVPQHGSRGLADSSSLSAKQLGQSGEHLSVQIPADRRVRRHRIIQGDTMESIAQHYLGDRNRLEEIVAINSHLLTHPDILPLGEYLIIPPAAATRRRLQQPEPSPIQPRALPARPLLPVK